MITSGGQDSEETDKEFMESVYHTSTPAVSFLPGTPPIAPHSAPCSVLEMELSTANDRNSLMYGFVKKKGQAKLSDRSLEDLFRVVERKYIWVR